MTEETMLEEAMEFTQVLDAIARVKGVGAFLAELWPYTASAKEGPNATESGLLTELSLFVSCFSRQIITLAHAAPAVDPETKQACWRVYWVASPMAALDVNRTSTVKAGECYLPWNVKPVTLPESLSTLTQSFGSRSDSSD